MSAGVRVCGVSVVFTLITGGVLGGGWSGVEGVWCG